MLIGIRRGFGGGADIYVVVWGWRLCQRVVAACERVVIFLWVGRGRALSNRFVAARQALRKKSYCLLYWFLSPKMSSTTV